MFFLSKENKRIVAGMEKNQNPYCLRVNSRDLELGKKKD